jgi:hypothetical protein
LAGLKTIFIKALLFTKIFWALLHINANGLNKRLGGIYYLLLNFVLIICNINRTLKT